MGIWVHDKFWHGRYSLELGRLCVSAAFALSDQVQLLLGASAPANRGSCRLMEAVGMTAGRTVQRDTEMGYQAELVEYTLTRSDWAARHATGFSVFGDDRIVVKAPAKATPRPLALEAVAVASRHSEQRQLLGRQCVSRARRGAAGGVTLHRGRATVTT